MKELLSLQWVEDLLPRNHRRKAMFGGLAYYVDDLMILALFEDSKDWNGCLFPVEREHHEEVMELFPELSPHKILGKWLYLPMQTENFESIAENIIERMKKEVLKGSGLFGVIPAKKKPKNAKKEKDPLSGIDYRRMDTRRPKMFADAAPEEVFKKAKSIADLKNLGPQTEKHFQKAGIKTVDAFVKMGWQKAFTKLAKSNPKLRHTLYAYALIGALRNTDWLQISPEEKAEAKELNAALKPKPEPKAKLTKKSKNPTTKKKSSGRK